MKVKHILIAGILASSSAWAADEAIENPITEDGVVKIEWQDPNSFRDIRSGGEIQSRFEKRTFEQLTKSLNKEAVKVLKPEQKLEMVVTDLDLAGDVRPTFGATTHDLRVVKNIYPPRITFSYKILQDDKVIMAGDEKLTDMNFMYSVNARNDKPYRYENTMLASWLKKTVKPNL
ncbi:DUF3016 domain-containing protein [Shewanella sp. 30m-9]